MTVGKLIEKLKQYPVELKVVVNAYEGGYDDIDELSIENVIIMEKNQCVYSCDYDDWKYRAGKQKIEALLLPR